MSASAAFMSKVRAATGRKRDNGVQHQNVFAYYLPSPVNYREHPACTKVCPSGAMHKRDDGFVVVNEEVCIGCRYCHMAARYGAPQYNAAKGHMTVSATAVMTGGGRQETDLRNFARCGRWILARIDEPRKKHAELAAVPCRVAARAFHFA